MFYSRRSMVATLATAVTAVLTESVLHAELQGPPQARPSPNTPNPDHPWGLAGEPNKPVDRLTINRQNQAEVRSSVEKLYQLAGELKEEVAKTDTNNTLPVSIVKKSQQIEKLAKHVREVAKS